MVDAVGPRRLGNAYLSGCDSRSAADSRFNEGEQDSSLPSLPPSLPLPLLLSSVIDTAIRAYPINVQAGCPERVGQRGRGVPEASRDARMGQVGKEHTTFAHRRGSTNPSQRPLLSTIIIIIIIVRFLQLFPRQINKSRVLLCCFSVFLRP